MKELQNCRIAGLTPSSHDPFEGMTANSAGGDEAKLLNRILGRLEKRLTDSKRSKCRDLFDKLDPVSYLKENLMTGEYWLSDENAENKLGPYDEVARHTPFFEGGTRMAGGSIVLNQHSFFFTGTAPNRQRFTETLTTRSAMFGLSMDEIREFVILHEMYHANDTKGRFDDNVPDNPRQNYENAEAINKLIRKHCF